MDRKLEILLVEDDLVACQAFDNLISGSDDMLLVGYTSHATYAVEIIVEHLPDVVILDLELHKGSGDGLQVLYALRGHSLSKKPYILVTTNNVSPTTYETARSLGADFIMSKHQTGYSEKGVLDFLRISRAAILNTSTSEGALQDRTTESVEQRNRRLQRRVLAELDNVGINPKSVGYTYLADAIVSYMQKPAPNICTPIAKLHGKTEASVERAIQNAINRAWRTSDTVDLAEHYKAKIDPDRGSPTITEFICYYAKKLKSEY